jgi:hypothetical protein
MKGKCQSRGHDHRSIVKRSERPWDRMDAPAASLEPLVMQDGVDGFGRRAQLASGGRPGIPKPLGSLAPAEKARAMARCESHRLIEEE